MFVLILNRSTAVAEIQYSQDLKIVNASLVGICSEELYCILNIMEFYFKI